MLPAIRINDWKDWTRVYNDVTVWRDLIDAICAREGINYRRLQPASGHTNAVFLLDRELALKIYSPFWNEYGLERALLEALRTDGEIPAPELVGDGLIADGGGVRWPYLITRYLGARPFSEIRGELADSDVASLAGQLGCIVRRLHSLDTSRFAGPSTERAWQEVVRDRRRNSVSELVAAGVIDPGLGGPLSAMLDEAIVMDKREPRIVVHGDLGGDHVLCAPTEDSWRIAALIDFGDAKIGAREYEWMPLWMGFCGRDPTLARAFLDEYDATLVNAAQFSRRTLAWTLLHDFGADELIRHHRAEGQSTPISRMDELQALLCPTAILQ